MELVKEKEYRIALAQIDEIIYFMDDEIVSKIPNSFKNFIKENKDRDYISNINPYMALEDQDLKPETQAMIALIYRSYIADEEEKENFKRKAQEEYDEIERKKIAKYNPDNIFKNKNILKRTTSNTENERMNKEEKALTVIHENFFKRVLSKIKNLISIIKNKNF